MSHTPKKLLSFAMALIMTLSLTTPALAVEPEADSNAVTYADLGKIDEKLVPAGAEDEDTVSVQETITILLEGSGLSQEVLGSAPDDYISLAKSLGMIDDEEAENLDADATQEQLSNMVKIFDQIQDAIENQTPLFLNGMAQPIFDYTSGAVEEGYSNEESNTIRYFVYVETNYDTDDDGKLDLVKVLVQMPRSAAEGNYKAATIFEARPYITGCTELWGYDKDLYGDKGYDLTKLYSQPEARNAATSIIMDWMSAKDFINAADSSEWYYFNRYEDIYDYEDLDWYDYYLVRGFAVVEAGGLGTLGSEGFETCGTDLEIDAFKCIIEWLHGDRIAYTDNTGTTAIEAYWSNGKVGMTGRSYAGTTQFGLATTGVKGLETIVPVAGIASWYDYTNSQGISTSRSPAYSDSLAGYCAGRYLDPLDWATIKEKYGNYLAQIRQDQLDLNGDYASSANTTNWASRDYTLNAENIQCSALIVHGLNDYNVRPKHFEMMYDAFKEAGAEVKLLLHQDGHVTPTYPSSAYSFLIGDESYDEILNRWFSHYLYGVENGIETMAEVTAQDSHENTWNTYESYATDEAVTLEVAEEGTTTITSNLSANGVTRSNWQKIYAAGSTACDAMYVADIEDDIVIKGSVDVTFRAAVANEETDNAPRGETQTVVDHDSYVDPGSLDRDNYINPEFHAADAASAVSIPDTELVDRDALMVSAMLVDLSDTEFPVFNTSGSYVNKVTLAEKGYWQAGNLKKFDLKEMLTTDVTYKVIARGWMDLCNPDAGFVSSSASVKVNLVEGQYYEYTICLQPTIYEVAEGHELALVIYTYEPSMASYNQNYTVTLDNASVVASIPVDGESASLVAAYDQIGTEYALNVSAGTGGSVVSSVENGEVAEGTEVTVTATADSGYKFTGWSIDGEVLDVADTTATFTITGDTTIVANFAKQSSGGGGGGSSVSAYTLTFNTNGGTSVAKVTKNAGTTITLSDYTTAKEGYTFAGWYADEGLTQAVSSVKLSKDMSVYAKWTENAPSSGSTYTDVDEDDWFCEAVGYVTENGIMNGTSANLFAPALSTTRGMIVTMLYRMEGEPAVTSENPFADVADGQYYTDPVIWAASNGIVTGITETSFAPNQNITREQLAVILYRYAQFKGYDVSVGEDTNILSFKDAESVSTYAVPAMQWAVGAGLINGIDGSLVPQGEATRAQVAAILMRFAENVAE